MNVDEPQIQLTLIEHGPDDCTTPPIDTAYLDRLVVTRMVENLLTNENLQTVIKIVQEQSGEMALQHRAELETTFHNARLASVTGSEGIFSVLEEQDSDYDEKLLDALAEV